MNDAPDAEQEPSPYLRLPMPVVALGLLVLLVGLFGLGLYANRSLRPQGTIPVATAFPATTSATPAVTATSLPVAGVQATPPAVQVTVEAAAPTQTPAPAAAVSTPEPTTATPTAALAPVAASQSPTPLPTVEPTLAAEVGQAYENFWPVRSAAELTLDPSHVSEVMDDGYLDHFLAVMNQLRQEGRAIDTQVALNYTVVQVNSQSALVHDRIEDKSFYIDPTTQAALTEPADDVERIEFSLVKTNGVWKVVDSVTEE
jgi:hypothetical protein